MHRKNFTLIELVSVILTTLLLGGLLSSALAHVKTGTDQATCVRNLYVIEKMAVGFSNDNNNYSLPSTFYPTDNDKVSFMTELYNQNNTARSNDFVCSAMDRELLFNPYDSNNNLYKAIDEASYIMNTIESFTGSTQVPNKARGWSNSSKNMLHNSRINNPSETFYILDAIERPETYESLSAWSKDMSSLRSWKETDHAPLPATTGTDRRDVGYHHANSSFNVLFGDGRVSNKLISQVDEWIATHE